MCPSTRRLLDRARAPRGSDHPLRRRELAEIDRLNAQAVTRVGDLSERESLVAGLALYAGDGSKRDGEVRFANSDPLIIAFFCSWLRRHFTIDESRLRFRLYLHDGLDLAAAYEHWSAVTGIPPAQFGRPYRAVPGAGIRHNEHRFGCAHIRYGCARTHRELMGLMRATLAAAVPGSLPEA